MDVDFIFGYPGGAILPIYDEIFKQNKIKHILVRHEQGAVHMAEGYARSTGKVGIVLVTSGPGATNAVTGLTDALMDSIPILCLTGKVPTHLIGTDAFQEADTVGITRSCTKHNYLVKDVNTIQKTIIEGYKIASSGRPGPVVVDLPKDIQNRKIGWFQKVETAAKYRDRVLKERIELIIKEKGNFTYEEIQKEVFKDLLDFYELFAGKAQFVRRPQYVDDVMERSAKKVVDFPFNYNSHQEFYSQKRKAMQDLAGSIGDYETGRAPRMTKKDYESLWNQITEVGTMNYNFKQDINDFTQRFLRIIGKYE